MTTDPGLPRPIKDSAEAVLMRGIGGNYLLADRNGVVGIATIRGILRREGMVPTIGDHVRYSASGDPDVPYRIDAILPRRNLLPRPPISNLDLLFVTVSATEPAPDLYMVDKLLILCGVHGIRPIVCITKCDLDARSATKVREVYESAGYSVRMTGFGGSSTGYESNLDALRGEIAGHIVGIAGQSGVGKSTLLNRMAERDLMPTGDVSLRIGRGRHTTRRVELFPFEGGYMADTPGFSMLDLWEAGVTGEQVPLGYPEILRVSDPCRFQGCRHVAEPGCAVEAAGIDPGRLERYRRFRSALDAIDPFAKRRPPPV